MRIAKGWMMAALAGAAVSIQAQTLPTNAGAAATGPAVTAPAAATPVSIVVFTDYQCPFSAHLYRELGQYERAHPGELRVTFKQSPLDVHPASALAHKAALAAARQGKFDAMSEMLYANQKDTDEATLLSYARELKLDVGRFKRDLESKAVADELAADMEESRAFGVDSTPTMYIQGKALIGEQTPETLAEALRKAAGANAAELVRASAPGAAAALDPSVVAAMEHAPSGERGTGGAALTVVEFTDFQCPFCRKAVGPMEQFMAAHEHDVHWVVRSFPLDFHVDSELANEAVLAAGDQGKFWQMHDMVFSHQDAIKLPDLRHYAEDLQLDMKQFDEALNTHRFAGKIAADRALGARAGVEGTPSFFVDGHPVSIPQSVIEWEQLLAQYKLPAGARPQVLVGDAKAVAGPERMVSGKADAALTLTWYTDVRSSQAAAQAELVRGLMKHYDGKARLVFKAFPLAMHADGKLAAAALVVASEEDKFWVMYDALTAHKETLDRNAVVTIAGLLKLNMDTFVAKLDDAQAAVQDDVEAAQRHGISGTPVIFLNDKRVDGLQREGFYTAIADQELGIAPTVQAAVAR